eukprot:2036751-Ditylum_brightwellii.AAC.1
MVDLKEKETDSLSNSALQNNIGKEENAMKEKTGTVESDDGRSDTEKLTFETVVIQIRPCIATRHEDEELTDISHKVYLQTSQNGKTI